MVIYLSDDRTEETEAKNRIIKYPFNTNGTWTAAGGPHVNNHIIFLYI